MTVNVISMLLFRVVVPTGIAVAASVEALEVVRMLLVRAAARIAAMIAIARIKLVIYMAVEAGAAAIVRASADKAATGKPLRSVIAIRSATVRPVPVVAIRARRPNADADRYLGLGFRSSRGEEKEK